MHIYNQADDFGPFSAYHAPQQYNIHASFRHHIYMVEWQKN